MAKSAGDIIKYILSFLLAGLLIWLAFRGIDWVVLIGELRRTQWGHVMLFIPWAVGALVFRMLFWHSMIHPLDSSVTFSRVWHANNVGNLANAVIPASGDLVRCGYVATAKAGYDKLLGTVAMERVWDAVSIAVLFMLAVAFDNGRFVRFFSDHIWAPVSGGSNLKLWLMIAFVLVVIVGFVVICFKFRARHKVFDKVAGFVTGIGNGFVSVIHMRRKLAFLGYVVGMWLMYVMMYFFILKATPGLSELGLVDAMFLAAVGNLASVVPVPGGMGAYHYLIALAVSGIYGASWETGILFATLQHELHAILLILFGVISYFRLAVKR